MMKTPNTVQVKLTIAEVMELIDFNWKNYTMFKNRGLPVDQEYCKKYKARAQFLEDILDETWPK